MKLLSRLHGSVHIYVMIVDLVLWWETPESDIRGVPESLALPKLDVMFYAWLLYLVMSYSVHVSVRPTLLWGDGV